MSLKKRITRAFVVLAIVLASFFSLVAYVSVEVIEAQVVDARLEKMADGAIRRHMSGHAINMPPDVGFFVNEQIPAALRQSTPGIHELIIDGHDAQAIIRQEGGNTYALIQNMDEFEQLELIIFSALAAGFVSSLLLAVVLGMTTAGRFISPVTALAKAVEHNTNPADLPSLDADDEIGVLARAFAKRNDELQRYLMRERLFTGDVSHELRTPLTVMMGAAEVLMAQLADRPRQLEVAARVRRVAAETAERVTALLLLSRAPELLDAPSVALTPLIQAEYERYRPLLVGKPVRCLLEWTQEVWVQARPELVGIIVGNLLRNACQHTESGVIHVGLTANQLVIEDQGPGLPEGVQTRLFERFVQGATDAAEGTGLGLSIVKRVAEHIGWTVRYEPMRAGGSRFILSFSPVQIRMA